MYRSLTATVPTQRDIATATQQDATTHKQLTLRLDSGSSHVRPRRPRMASQAPIERLPIELLSYIFILGAHTPDLQDFDSDPTEGQSEPGGYGPYGEDENVVSPCVLSSSTPPDVFAAVNRHWRAVALGTPKLWTRICVTIGDLQHGSSDGGWFPTVSRYVSRSRRCPLDIYIDARDPEWDFSEEESVFNSSYTRYCTHLNA